VLNSLLFWRKKILTENGIEIDASYKDLAQLFKIAVDTLTFLNKGHLNELELLHDYNKQLHDALTRTANVNKNLREQLAQKEVEIEQINARKVVSLS
jgi:hypothetical protein